MDELTRIKSHPWFYEFPLPDGTKTTSYLPPEVAKIHNTREHVLRRYLESARHPRSTALDVSCHEGFFSQVLGEYFTRVTGIDKNQGSLDLARQMGTFLKKQHVSFQLCPVEEAPASMRSDFVLCYGLIYHIENPMQVLRKLGELTNRVLCIETQVLPFSASCRIEDGYYQNQRELKGLFGLCADYPESKEGGLTNYALVPTQDAVVFMLKELGFKAIDVYNPTKDDYEQFVRGSRIILFAEK